MEKDPKILNLIRESGLTRAPENFTGRVMDKLRGVSVKSTYKPLIGRGGKIMGILLIIGIALVTVFYSEPGSGVFEKAKGFSNIEWQLPKLNFNFDFISEIHISAWIVSTIVALFLLILLDTGLSRRRKLI